jgi:hypothetical protein
MSHRNVATSASSARIVLLPHRLPRESEGRKAPDASECLVPTIPLVEVDVVAWCCDIHRLPVNPTNQRRRVRPNGATGLPMLDT